MIEAVACAYTNTSVQKVQSISIGTDKVNINFVPKYQYQYRFLK